MKTESTEPALAIPEEDHQTTPPVRRYRFEDFELCSQPLELSRNGQRLELSPQPARLLELLASRAGQVVSRTEIRKTLWGEDVHVDFERGINFNIRQIRSILGDDSSSPRFIETIPRQGYRFVAPLLETPSVKDRRWFAASAALLILVAAALLFSMKSTDSHMAAQASRNNELANLPPLAAETYLVGRRLLESSNSVDLARAKEAFESTLATSPEFAPAQAGLAKAHISLLEIEEAEQAALRALELDASKAEAHLVLAGASMYQSLQVEKPTEHLELALALEPDNRDGLKLFSSLLTSQGRTQEAVEVTQHLLALDPLSWEGRWNHAWCLFMDRQYEAAVEQIRDSTQLYPQHSATPYQLLLQALIRLGRTEEAVEEADRYLGLHDWPPGTVKTMDDWWKLTLKTYPQVQTFPGSQLRSQRAILHLGLGQTQEALELLENACEERSTWDLRYLRVDPRFDSLRLEARFQEILDCMANTPPEGSYANERRSSKVESAAEGGEPQG